MDSHLTLLEAIQESVTNEEIDNTYKVESLHFKFNGMFRLLEFIKNKLCIEKRYSCLVENLLQRRDENWPESITDVKGPKTMDEIFKDHTNQSNEQPQHKPETTEHKPRVKKETKVYKKPEEIKEGLEKLFKMLNAGKVPSDEGEVDYTLECFIRDTQGLYNASKTTEYLEVFFELFWSDQIKFVEKRLPLFKKLVDHHMFDKKDILKGFNEFLLKAYLYASDCPKLAQFAAKIY